MNAAGVAFVEITAALEDMHGVAIEGQSATLTTSEGWVLLGALRDGVQSVSRLLVDVALTLE